VLTPRLFYRGVNTPRSPTLPEGSHPPSANSTGGFTPPARQLYRGVHTPRPRGLRFPKRRWRTLESLALEQLSQFVRFLVFFLRLQCLKQQLLTLLTADIDLHRLPGVFLCLGSVAAF
jgi:hypothetical protein